MMNFKLLSTAIALLVASHPAYTMQSAEGYRLPPSEVVEIIDAVPNPSLRFSPDKQWALAVQGSAMPTIADVSRRMLRIAGMRIDPLSNSRYQTNFSKEIVLAQRGLKQTASRVALPKGARVSQVLWSHDSKHFAYVIEGDQGSALYGTSVERQSSGLEPRLLTDRLNTVTGSISWMPDGASLLCLLVPGKRGVEPQEANTPSGPNIQEAGGDTSPLRTYQDLLSNSHDEALFDHYCTTQLAVIELESGAPREVGSPAIYMSASPSPDGQKLLVSRLERPYSYLMPWYKFPHEIAVLNLDGKESYRVANVPLAENIPLGGVRLGRRSVSWNPHNPASLLWVEALDGGDPKREVEQRDKWMALSTPFTDAPTELLRTEHRARGLTWLENKDLVISSEYDRARRWTRSSLTNLAVASTTSLILEDRSTSDRYGNPGTLVRKLNAQGRGIVRMNGDYVYRTGRGASPDGLLPFLDRQDLRTLETERLWRCEPGQYESVSAILEDTVEGLSFLTRHETPDSPPNYRERRIGSKEFIAQSDFAHPAPQLQGIHKQLVTYERADGVPLSATLYLPADYEEGTRLPLLVWAYPREFSDPKLAGQVSSSPSFFTRIGGLSHLVLLTQGYAIMDGATMPVIGDPETMNDTFVEQIVAAAQAAIDKAVDLGVADRERVVVGGHSYGAFMTANLLAHCDLFATGVARSGAYNRTLTPFGFQSERRTFWEAPEAYFNVSPFMHAHKINEPLLMIHGELDNNSGTFPLQSERLFQAIKGNGGTARLVMLPSESHGYRARESVLHVHAETIAWFDRFLNRSGRPVEASSRESEK